MRRIPKLVRVIAVVGALSLVASACGDDGETGGTDTTTTDGDTTDGTDSAMGDPDGIVQADVVEPRSLITTHAGESEGITVLKALCRGLTYLDNEGNLANLVAADISTEDNVVWTVTLNEGWTFHDGSALDAQDYVDTWNFGADPRNGQQNNGFYNIIEGYPELNPEDPDGAEGPQEAPEPTVDSLTGLEVIDELTFQVTLTGPNTTFPLRLPYAAYYAMPSEVVTGGEEAVNAFNEEPICNGPYRMDGPWQHEVVINTVSYEDYAGPDAPANGGVTFNIVTDSTTAWQELVAGNLSVSNVPPEFLEQAQSEFETAGRFAQQPSDSFTYMGFPVYDEQFANPELRQALSMAVDRQLIVDTILSGNAEVAHSWIAPIIPGHRENPCSELGTTELDLEAATAKFDAAGGFEGTMTLWVNAGNETAEQWVTAIGNMWKNAFGIEFEIEQLPFAEYLELYYGKTLTGPFRLGWGMDYPHPQNYLEPLYGTVDGYTGYSSAEFDAALAAGNAEAELDAAIPHYQQAEDLLCTDMPVIPLYFGVTTYAWNDTVDNVVLDGYGDFEWTQFVVTA
ncbi:MAG TPA: ABC transporter substrate-binding protein [Nitriliruptorales bacterium]